MRTVATFLITLASIALLCAGVAYPPIGWTIAAGLMVICAWGIVDSMFGHHFDSRS
jgi:hypothetical protein